MLDAEEPQSSPRLAHRCESSTYTLKRQRDEPQLQLFMHAPVSHIPFSPDASCPAPCPPPDEQLVKPTSDAAPADRALHLTKLRRVNDVSTFPPSIVSPQTIQPPGPSPETQFKYPTCLIFLGHLIRFQAIHILFICQCQRLSYL